MFLQSYKVYGYFYCRLYGAIVCYFKARMSVLDPPI